MHVQVPHVCEFMCRRVYMHTYAYTTLTSDVFIGFSLPHPLKSGLSRTERWMIWARLWESPISTFRALESQAGWHAHVGIGYLNASPFPQLHPYPLNRQTSAPKQTSGSAARTAAGARVPSPSSGPTEQHATLSSMSLRQNPSLSLSRIPLQHW